MAAVEQAAERDHLLAGRDEPATRGDLSLLAAEIRAEIAALESRLLWRLLGGGGLLLLLSRLADFLT